MSLAVLKRKTAAKYNNSSVGEPQFSLNGTRRNQGYIGQDSRSRFTSRTLMKGNVIKGHGGSNGEYKIGPIVSSSVKCMNDPIVVKTSSLGNMGHIMTKYRWARRPVIDSDGNVTGYSVKPDSNIDNYSANGYTIQIRKKAIDEAGNCSVVSTDPVVCNPDVPMSRNCKSLNVTSNEADTGAISSELYTLALGRCNVSDDVRYRSSISGGPLPGN